MITLPRFAGELDLDTVADLTISEGDTLFRALTSDRSNFVIDLRDGDRTESFLRMAPHSAPAPRIAYPGVGPLGRRAGRALDVVVALTGIVVTSPLWLLSAAAVSLTSKGPVVFTQERVGRNGKIFWCMKFRSMRVDAEEGLEEILAADDDLRAQWIDNQKIESDTRITRIGKFLRRTSLDELPQLLNVLRGEMSIVGPRPVVPPETVRYGDDLVEVLSVKPGITGLWQVSGRNNLTYPERVELDVHYVRSQSLRQDVAIMARTFKSVMAQDGAS